MSRCFFRVAGSIQMRIIFSQLGHSRSRFGGGSRKIPQWGQARLAAKRNEAQQPSNDLLSLGRQPPPKEGVNVSDPEGPNMSDYTQTNGPISRGTGQESAWSWSLDPYLRGSLSDTGCKHSPSCLKCPLPQCVHDMTRADQTSFKRDMRRWRDQAIALSVFAGVPVAQVAEDNGIMERTVYRVLERVRNYENERS